jgi:uncharacterized protein (TIGR02391 family)
MPPNSLAKLIEKKLGISSMTLWRRCRDLDRQYGPISQQEARWVIAHGVGIDLRKHGLTDAELERVRGIRFRIGEGDARRRDIPAVPNAPRATRRDARPRNVETLTPAGLFDVYNLHSEVARSSRRLFVGGHYREAVRAAFQRLNNRVRKLSGLKEDGVSLMSHSFKKEAPRLQMTALRTDSEQNEQEGLRFLMMGSMAALRNPCTHEDHWPPVEETTHALEALALASLLHNYLDRCLSSRSGNPEA